MKLRFTLFALLFVSSLFLTSSCQKSLSDDHIKYVGSWGSDKHSIEIWKNGRGIYQKQNQEAIECDVKIENNIIKFRHEIHKNFYIEVDPYVNGDGFTVMNLDGRPFYKH